MKNGNTISVSQYPELFQEWDKEKNTGVELDSLTAGSNKKYWWICKRNHSWSASLHNRTRGNNCPYCAGLYAWPGETDLKTLFPELSLEWNYIKNKPLTPDVVRPKSNKKYWWICRQGHEWEDSPNHRTVGRGCPYCSHRRVLPENSLSFLFPEIAKEWGRKNSGKPLDYAAYSNKTVFWKCSKCGHEWKAIIASRTNLHSGCPLCSNQIVVTGVNDLKTLQPALAEEWDYDKNVCLPEEVGAGSEKKAFWKCFYGHSWEARINSRVQGSGCPICSRYFKTSLKEFVVYYYLSNDLNGVIQSFRAPELNRREIDIYLPFLSTGIEYDGQEWHKNKTKDNEKDELCKKLGIKLIRIREPGCEKICREDPTIVLEDTTIDGLQIGLEKLYQILELPSFRRSIANDINDIYSKFHTVEIHNNLAEKNPFLASEWDITLNKPLLPVNVPAKGSQKKFFWKCNKCGYSWEASLEARMQGRGCPVCAGRLVKAGYNDLTTQLPELAKEWHPSRNGDLTPEKVTKGSGKQVWWQCKKGHEWKATIYDRVKGTSCPFCAGKKVLSGYNDLATINPLLAEEWALDFNKKTPREVTTGSGYKAKWICKKCGYTWIAAVYSRSAGTGCPQCAKKEYSG